MSDFVNRSDGMLILPPTKEGQRKKVSAGDVVALSGEALKHPAVAEWVERGMLIKAAKGNTPPQNAKKVTKKRLGLEANANALGVVFDESTTDQELIDLIKAAKGKA